MLEVLFAIPHCIGLMSNLILFLLFFNQRSTRINQIQLFFSFAIIVWVGAAIPMFFADIGLHSALICARVLHGAIIALPPMIFHLAVNLRKANQSKYLISGFYITSALFVILCPTNLIISGIQRSYFTYMGMGGKIYWMYVLYLSTVITFALLLLNRKKNLLNYEERRLFSFITFGILIAFLAGLNDLISILFHRYTYPIIGNGIYPWSGLGIGFYGVLMFYTITRYGEFDINRKIQKIIYYSLLSITISSLYVMIIYFMYLLFENLFIDKLSNTTAGIIIFILGLAFKPLESVVKRVLDYYFFKGTIFDLFSQKEHLESELERTHRLKSVGILAAGMAHEIRNPIQSLRTFGEHLEKNHNDPEFRAKFEKLLKQETDRIKNLTSDLLDFSKPKEPKKVKTDLNELINQTLSLLESDLMAEGVKVKRELPDKIIYKEVDPEQIKQALLNLFINAKDAMKSAKNKELHVSLKEIQSKARIIIQDTGCGISEQKIPHLFDPFFTEKTGGTGLGLAVTHSVITKNSGDIKVVSSVNNGARFDITFN